MAYGRRSRRYYGKRYYGRRKRGYRYKYRYRRGFKSGFRYGGTYGSELRGKTKDFGVQSVTTLVFNRTQDTNKCPYALLALNAYDILFGTFPDAKGNVINNWQSFHKDYPNLQTGRIRSVKWQMQLTTTGTAPLEITHVVLPYVIQNGSTALQSGTMVQSTGDNVKGQMLQITTTKQRTVAPGTYYWTNPLVRSMTASASVQDNLDLDTLSLNSWGAGNYSADSNWWDIERNPKIFNPTLYVLLQNIQQTADTTFTLQIKTNFTLAFQVEQFNISGDTNIVNPIVVSTLLCSTSNVRAMGRSLENINQLSGKQKLLARIVQADDDNVYLDESNGIMIDNTCYSKTNNKYHVKAYIDLQPPPASVSLLQNQYQSSSANIPYTIITEWGDYNMNDHPQQMIEINRKYTFPMNNVLFMSDDGTIIDKPNGTSVCGCSSKYTLTQYIPTPEEYMSMRTTSGWLDKTEGSIANYVLPWNFIYAPQSVPVNFGYTFSNPTDFLQTMQEFYQETLQAWPLAWYGVEKPTTNTFGHMVQFLSCNIDPLIGVDGFDYSNFLNCTTGMYINYIDSNNMEQQSEYTVYDLLSDVQSTSSAPDPSTGTAYAKYCYDMYTYLNTYGCLPVILCIKERISGAGVMRKYVSALIYKENTVSMQMLYFMQQLIPQIAMVSDRLTAWMSNYDASQQLSCGCETTDMSYEFGKSIATQANTQSWKKFWSKVKGGFSTAWNWVRKKAVPIIKNVVAPVLPGPVGTVVGAIATGVETVGNVVDVVANRKKKANNLGLAPDPSWAPTITFKCTPRYALTEQGSSIVPIYEDGYWSDGGEANIIPVSVDNFEVNSFRYNIDVKNHILQHNMGYLANGRNHIIRAADGTEEDYPYQLQSSMVIEVDTPSQTNYDLGQLQLIASNQVSIEETQNEVTNQEVVAQVNPLN